MTPGAAVTFRDARAALCSTPTQAFAWEAVRIDGAVPSLSRIGFNDRASSIAINRGVWEVCVDANFRGRCEIIDASARPI
jgi:hypothetical protein